MEKKERKVGPFFWEGGLGYSAPKIRSQEGCYRSTKAPPRSWVLDIGKSVGFRVYGLSFAGNTILEQFW